MVDPGAPADISARPGLLFLCHRLPFPPNKGDKIRSYHLLKYLSVHYRVYLGAFVDDPADWEYAGKVEDLCEGVCLIKLNPKLARLKSLWGFCAGRALSLPYYSSWRMARWVKHMARDKDITRVVVYSSVMAQYVSGDYAECHKVADMVDVDSEKWREYAQRQRFPMNWVYAREAIYLLKFEQAVAKTFDRSLFVSTAEADKFKELTPQYADRISSYSNGVDTDYFSPEPTCLSPYEKNERVLVFTGAMDYWPNIDAVNWFATQVFPALYNANPQIRFYIVGSKPTAQVRSLADSPGVVVTGGVPDVRPYLRHGLLAVAPMRIARGIQNKVLEAMAMALPVIVSAPALEGIDAEHGRDVLLAMQPDDYAVLVEDVLAGKYSYIGRQARDKVKQEFNWGQNLPIVGRLLEGDTR